MNKFEAIIEVMKSWDTEEVVQAWNERCDDYNDGDSRIEYMDSFSQLPTTKVVGLPLTQG